MRHKPITVTQMVEVDRLMIEEYGIELIQMMENAGRTLGELVRRLLGGSVAGRKIVVLVGKGNNGGGGMVAARHLANAGAYVTLALSASPSELGRVPEHQHRILERMDLENTGKATSPNDLPGLLSGADMVIDALIGYSLHGAPREPIVSFIKAANESAAPVVSLDIPSGLDGDTGVAYEPCLRAGATLTLAWPKAGLLKPTAKPYVGELYLADISVPTAVYRALGVEPGPLFSEGPLVWVRTTHDDWEVNV